MEENKIEEPIGKFIIDNAKGTETQNGVYYHYSDVCTLLNKQKEQLILSDVVSTLPKKFSAAAYTQAITGNYEEFVKWWDER